MAESRKVRLALIAYKGADGNNYYGQANEEIEVHADDLARFDKLNDQHGTDDAPSPVRERPAAEVGPDPLDHGSDPAPEVDEEDGFLPEPSTRDSVEAWRAYAEQEGVEDFDTKTKKQLISELTTD